MAKREQADTDPLPFTQLDRAAKAKAATLATLIGVPYQYALGGLLEFWESCGDPRTLEELALAGKTEVVLSRAEVEGRLCVAFGKPVDPEHCRRLGFLEARPDGYRVRGMSRYFLPILNRLGAKARASEGGKASAASRRQKTGSSQPVRKNVEPAPNGPLVLSNSPRTVPNPIGQRSAVSDQKEADLFPDVVPVAAPKELSDHEVLFSDFCARRRARLVELELPPDDEPISPAFINATGIRWKRWFLEHEPGLDEYSDRMPTLLIGLVAAYLDLTWPADKSPPYPFKMIASEKVWLPIAESLIITEAA